MSNFQLTARTEILNQIKMLFELKELGALTELEFQEKKKVLMSDLV